MVGLSKAGKSGSASTSPCCCATLYCIISWSATLGSKEHWFRLPHRGHLQVGCCSSFGSIGYGTAGEVQ